jgi:uncharacterized protein (TIGR03435 family)
MTFKSVAVLLAAASAFAQTPAPLTFDVATIKPAQMPTPQAMMAGKIRIGETIDAGRADYGLINVEYLITKAYNVKTYQITGPSWLQSERFDISAKLPSGATKDQVPEMLKALLAERFGITLHHETKEHAVYVLVIGKGGPKFRESTPEAADDTNKVAGAGMSMTPSGDGRGMTVKTPQGNFKMGPGADGSIKMEGSQVPMDSLIEMLTRFVDKPVVDETGLKGKYDITLEMSMSDMMAMARNSGMAAQMGGGRGPGAPAEAASDPSGGTIFQTVQNLGLRLEPKKTQMDVLVIDKGNKVPTDN